MENEIEFKGLMVLPTPSRSWPSNYIQRAIQPTGPVWFFSSTFCGRWKKGRADSLGGSDFGGNTFLYTSSDTVQKSPSLSGFLWPWHIIWGIRQQKPFLQEDRARKTAKELRLTDWNCSAKDVGRSDGREAEWNGALWLKSPCWTDKQCELWMSKWFRGMAMMTKWDEDNGAVIAELVNVWMGTFLVSYGLRRGRRGRLSTHAQKKMGQQTGNGGRQKKHENIKINGI